jgi:hypothetical protein
VTRRDVATIAQTMRQTRPKRTQQDAWHQWCTDMMAIATALQGRAPHFERDTFMVQCGADECETGGRT